jgi:ribonuclease HI
MVGSRDKNHRDGTLRVFQANVNRAAACHDVALNLAAQHGYDVVLLQEPSTFTTRDGSPRTVTHPTFDAYTPVTYWEDNEQRPRVLTYVRRSEKLYAEQLHPPEGTTRDYLWILVNGITVINVYRQGDQTLDKLLTSQLPPKTLVAGDFNAIHYTWQPGRSAYGAGERIADWAHDRGLDLLNQDGQPTHQRGNTIDLALTDIWFATATVEHWLGTGSDHHTITIDLPYNRAQHGAVERPRYRITTEEETKRFAELLQEHAQWLPEPTVDIDAAAGALKDLFAKSLQAAGHRAVKTAKAAPWWGEESKMAAQRYRTARATGYTREAQIARRELQHTVRREKRKYWDEVIAGASQGSDIFKITRWVRSQGPFQAPPLVVGGETLVTREEKAAALRKATLERRQGGDDIRDPWRPLTNQPQDLAVDLHVTEADARTACTTTGNTSPGADGITVRLLRAAWPVLGSYVTQLYQECLTQGYYPRCFRTAQVVMIPKPGKKDLTETRAWRPISLLSCLGKGLERLLAKRIAWVAVRSKVLAEGQAGALPKRSAVDLAAAATHEIETALAEGHVATLVTIDVQGAFDTVQRNRLVLRLREQGWPDQVARWVETFMTYRRASIRYEGIEMEEAPLLCGLPQGSPISPILFLLYTEPIYRRKLDSTDQRLGYADDAAILTVGPDLRTTAAQSTKAVEDLEYWGSENGVTFDPIKTEVMHFTRRRDEGTPTITHQGQVKAPGEALRWLGIWFDRRLTFRKHVDKWITKATRITHLLRNIASTVKGPTAASMRRAVVACVVPLLTYGAEAWFPGLRRPSVGKSRKMVSSQVATQVQKIQSCLNKTIAATLPIWKTTPLAARYREAAIPPVELLLHARQQAFAVRIRTLDADHPLATRAVEYDTRCTTLLPRIKIPRGHRRRLECSRLRRAAALAPSAPRPSLQPPRPSPPDATEGLSKEEATEAFKAWQQQATGLIVFSDGSQVSGATGWGFMVWDNDERAEVADGHGRLDEAEVYDAEIVGALKGLQHAATIAPTGTTITVALDSTTAITALRGWPGDSSQQEALDFSKLAQEKGATVKWAPGHKDIAGNERADQLAKMGTQDIGPGTRPTIAFIRRRAREEARGSFQEWWDTARPESYAPLQLKAKLSCPAELRVERPLLQRLLAARSGHGDFAEYHERFNHDEANLHCSCGRRKEPNHLFYCRKVTARLRPRLAPAPAAAIHRAIGADFDVFIKLARETRFFTAVCPR